MQLIMYLWMASGVAGWEIIYLLMASEVGGGGMGGEKEHKVMGILNFPNISSNFSPHDTSLIKILYSIRKILV